MQNPANDVTKFIENLDSIMQQLNMCRTDQHFENIITSAKEQANDLEIDCTFPEI